MEIDSISSRHPIVGIGASAGGLDALQVLTSHLAPEAMAFIVLQHLAPDHDSSLVEILQRRTKLPVVTAEDGAVIAPNHIYVTPPSFDVSVQQGRLRLSEQAPGARKGPRHSIDTFLRSLAEDQGESAIGVILSGSGSDGALGLRSIKHEGGITFAQEPSSAAHAEMPQTALDAGCADFCLTPDEIGDELTRLSRDPYVAPQKPDRELHADSKAKLLAALRDAFDVDFTHYKQNTIDRRIQRRMALHKLERLEDYLTYVQTGVTEIGALYSDLLIGVTRFFRDREPFDAIKDMVLPQLLRTKDGPLRMWVAGCSTGEEAYSLAMCFLELTNDRSSSPRIQIFATDIDERSLQRARLGVYPENIALDVSAARLARFFTRTDKGAYQVIRQVRDCVIFARHNLVQDPPFSRIDIVSCRNVLIYMQPALQQKVLRTFHYALSTEGFLQLGVSETTGESAALYSSLDRKLKLFTRLSMEPLGVFDFNFGSRSHSEAQRSKEREQHPLSQLLQHADRKVLERFAPPSIVVNEHLELVQLRGKTGRFISPTPGLATTNLLTLLRPELAPSVRHLFQRALAENIAVASSPIALADDDLETTVVVEVLPLPVVMGDLRSFLVLFNHMPQMSSPTQEQNPTALALDDANARLQAANEELQSTNEELQSTNEELETSKEEMQSTNEELQTLNDELQNRVAQLNLTSDDLENVLATASTGMLLVGLDLRIRRFSLAAEKLLNLIPSDVGRPLAHVRTVLKARDIELTVTDAIRSLSAKEQRVRSIDGDWYLMRIVPYRTTDRVIRGAVIEFTKSTAAERREEPLEVRGLGAAILGALPQALALLDAQMRIVWAGKAFLDFFAVGVDIFGRPLEDIWNETPEASAVWSQIEEAVLHGKPLSVAQKMRPFTHAREHVVQLTARPLRTEDDGGRQLTLLTLAIDLES